MHRGGNRNLHWLWVSLAVVILDQISKQYAQANLVVHDAVGVMPFFDLTLTYNAGAAFGLLSTAGGWQRWFFVALAVLISGCIVFWLRNLDGRCLWLPCALALILGGALGNLWDRLSIGAVIDFLDFYVGNWHWPAFNLADSAITIGASMWFIDAFRRVPTTED